MATYKTGFAYDPKAAGDKQAPPHLMKQFGELQAENRKWADENLGKGKPGK